MQAKKNPERFKKFVELDFKYIGLMKDFLDELVAKKLLREMDSNRFSELIYGIVAYEFLMYVYDHDVSKQTMMSNVKVKLEMILQGYVIGGANGH